MALQIHVARADAEDVVLPERRRITSRIRALLKAHGETWTAPLRAIADATYTFRRGFIEHVANYQDRNFGFVAGPLLDAAPLLRAASIRPGALHSIIMNEASARFEELAFEQPSLDEQMLARLTERLEVGALRSLEIEGPHISSRDTQVKLATWPSALEHFGIAGKPHKGVLLSSSFVERFAAAPNRHALRSLRFEGVGLERLERLTTLPAVESISLTDCRMAWQHGNLLKIVSALPALTSLAVVKDRIATYELEEVVEAVPTIRRAVLRHMDLGDIDVVRPWAPQLRRLDLMGNPLGDAAAHAIAALDWPHLIELRFPATRLGDAAKQTLADRFGDVFA